MIVRVTSRGGEGFRLQTARLAIAATRGIRNQLFGLSAIDPVTFVSAIVVVSGTILVATLLPARRATRVDPVVALRYE